ncbi:Golgin subfamily A member 7/ERF4 family [Popillia japonica]|uniref:Golgin subfamily A member 7/ERF4 family n=1 Tax=Popillia japonica TaxID=7064 RepID=A0AAW1MKE4_POPJA
MDRYSGIYYQEGEDSSDDPENTLGVDIILVPEPITLRGVGSVTIFGLNNKFSSELPSTLHSRVAPEEYKETIDKINRVLRKNLPTNARLLFFGCFFCCCTFGCSFWPVICSSRRTLRLLHRLLERENRNLYYKLGLRWHLSKQHLDASNLLEYVILIEFLPRIPIYKPD